MRDVETSLVRTLSRGLHFFNNLHGDYENTSFLSTAICKKAVMFFSNAVVLGLVGHFGLDICMTSLNLLFI